MGASVAFGGLRCAAPPRPLFELYSAGYRL